MAVQHRFAFADEAQAKRFLARLRDESENLTHLAHFHAPGSSEVTVVDPYDPPRTERILQLARFSSATWARWTPPE